MKTTLELTVEVEVDRPPSVVWSFIADPERMPEWFVEFKAAHTDGSMGLGAVVHYTLTPGDRSGTIEIVEWDPPHRLAWDGPPLRWAGGGARPRGSHALTPTGEGGTLVVSNYRPELSGSQVLLRPYLKRWLRRERRASAQALKALLEAEAAS